MTNPKVKGATFERWVANSLSKRVGKRIRRGLQSQAGHVVPDVDFPGLWIECKRGKLTNPRTAMKQAIAASEAYHEETGIIRTPVAICKDDGLRPYVVMRYCDWLEGIQPGIASVDGDGK